jgi:Uma2 family endonuclease
MAIVAGVARPTEPTPLRWTVAEYYRLAEAGVLGDRATELANGEIVEMPRSMNRPHADALIAARDLLLPRRPPGCELGQHAPMTVAEHNDRLPDAMIYRREDRHPLTGHPTRPLLVLEISDWTLRYDQGDKRRFYAAGVPTYWLLDLNGRQLHVFTEPDEGDYAATRRYRPGEAVALPWPAEPIAVADLLPPAH